jgi:hypothetical protein
MLQLEPLFQSQTCHLVLRFHPMSQYVVVSHRLSMLLERRRWFGMGLVHMRQLKGLKNPVLLRPNSPDFATGIVTAVGCAKAAVVVVIAIIIIVADVPRTTIANATYNVLILGVITIICIKKENYDKIRFALIIF